MSVGGQEIGVTAANAGGTAAPSALPIMRAHNLRYSSAVNDFSNLMQDGASSPIAEEKAQNVSSSSKKVKTSSQRQLNRSDLS